MCLLCALLSAKQVFKSLIHYISWDHSDHCFTRRKNVTVKNINKTVLSKNHRRKTFSKNLMNKKLDLEDLPFTTMKITLRMLKWIFVLIFVYIAVSIVFLIAQGGDEQIRNIIVYSVSGFFTFFMGYFGWMFARSVSEIVGGKKPQGDDF